MSDGDGTKAVDVWEFESRSDRLAKKLGVDKVRVQRWLSYMVVASRLEKATQDPTMQDFTIKGGVALELRLSGEGRATKDLDLIVGVNTSDRLASALRQGLDRSYQGFSFRVKGRPYHMEDGTVRCDVALEYKGRSWNTIRIDLSPDEGHHVEQERVPPLDLGHFPVALEEDLSCLSLRYHIAHKIHGMTAPAAKGRENERFHDLVDVHLIRERL